LNRKGFTLVELLVAASLFLTAVVAFSYLLKTSIKTAGEAKVFNQAVYALQAKKEELMGVSFESLALLDGAAFARGAGKIYITPALADLVNIKLVLFWAPKKAPLRLNTLRSKYQ
jgi:prepilin-type N-terminal cleavage/methylation domain-containing protein